MSVKSTPLVGTGDLLNQVKQTPISPDFTEEDRNRRINYIDLKCLIPVFIKNLPEDTHELIKSRNTFERLEEEIPQIKHRIFLIGQKLLTQFAKKHLEAFHGLQMPIIGTEDTPNRTIDPLSQLYERHLNAILHDDLGIEKTEFSTEDVEIKANKRLVPITAAEIEEQVLQAIPINKREEALRALFHLTQWASIDSLNFLTESILGLQESSLVPIYRTGSNTLIDALAYLNKNNPTRSDLYESITSPRFEGVSSRINSVFDIGERIQPKSMNVPYSEDYNVPPNGFLVLDKNILAELQSSPRSVQTILDNNVTLLYPEAWINGITPFNQHDLSSVLENINYILHNNGDVNSSVMTQLEQLDPRLLEQLKIIKADQTINPNPTIEDIVNRLAPKRLSSEEIEERITNYTKDVLSSQPVNNIQKPTSEKIKKALQNMLVHDSQIYSPRAFSIMCKEHYRKLLQEVSVLPENLYFANFKENSSYSIVLHIYSEVNGIPKQNIVRSLEELPNQTDNKFLIVLDDMSLSGSNFSEMNWSRMAQYPITKILSPIITTSDAAHKYYIGELIPLKVFDTSKQYTYLEKLGFSEKEIEFYNTHVLKKSFYGKYLAVVLPWMSPDNNSDAFRQFASGYTFLGEGIKIPD